MWRLVFTSNVRSMYKFLFFNEFLDKFIHNGYLRSFLIRNFVGVFKIYESFEFWTSKYYLYLIKHEECCILFYRWHGMIENNYMLHKQMIDIWNHFGNPCCFLKVKLFIVVCFNSLKCIVPIFNNISGLQKKLNLTFEIFLVF